MTNVVSKDAVPSLDYLKSAFRTPTYDSRITDTTFDFHYPVSGTRNTTCLRWVIPRSSGNKVPNIEKLILALNLKIVNKAKNGRPPMGIESAPTNNFINSIFGTLTISYNTTVVCKIDNYGIYNYTRLMMNCDDNDFKTWLTPRCFYREGEDEDLDDTMTEGWKKRRSCFGGTIISPKTIKETDESGNEKDVDNPDLGKFKYSNKANFFIGTLDHFLETPPILSDCDIHVQLDLAKPAYAFHSKDDTAGETDINFDIEKARLFIPSITLNDQLYTQLKTRLDKEPMRQFYTSTSITTHSISTGDKSTVFSSICQGQYPNRVLVLLQETDRYLGKFSVNSLKFSRAFNAGVDPFILQSASMKLNTKEIDALSCDDAVHSFKDEYFRLLNLTNQDTGKNCCSITFKDFVENNCFLLYDFTASMNLTEPPLQPLSQKGNLRLQLNFDKATTCPLTLIVICEYSSSLTIEDSGKVTVATL